MLISIAQAQEAAEQTLPQISDDISVEVVPEVSPWAAVGSQVILILVLVVLFYVLLIMPQQRRFKEHKAMLDSIQKGDEVVTAGGLVGKVDKLEGDDKVVVDLGNSVKVTALRSTIQTKVEK